MRSGRGIRHTLAERGNDLYQTPPEATRALIAHERLPLTIWEASCGRGAIVNVLRAAGHEVLATDKHDYGWDGQDASGMDFLDQYEMPMQGVDCIVQNPPFSMAALFVKRSIELCPLVYMLLPLRFLEAGNEKTEAGRARLFCLDQGHLARVLVFRERLPMMHRDGWDGPKSTSTTAFGWFCFSWAHRGPAQIYRISWQGED